MKLDDIRKNLGNVYRLKNQIAMRAKDGEFIDYDETSGQHFLVIMKVDEVDERGRQFVDPRMYDAYSYILDSHFGYTTIDDDIDHEVGHFIATVLHNSKIYRIFTHESWIESADDIV